MTRAERSQQKVDDVLLKLEGYTWKRARFGCCYLQGSIGSGRSVGVAEITRPRKYYYAEARWVSLGFPRGGPFPTLAKAKAYVAEKFGCRGKA
jgi:hypothetical protein